MSIMPDRHECRWKDLYNDLLERYNHLLQAHFDYNKMTEEEFKEKYFPSKKDGI